MADARAPRGGRPRKQGWEEDPLVTVSVHLRKSQLAALDQLATLREQGVAGSAFIWDPVLSKIKANGKSLENAIWTYEEPHEAVAGIRDHLAFYPDRMTIEERND